MKFFEAINLFNNFLMKAFSLIPKILNMILGIPGLIIKHHLITFPIIFYVAMEFMCYKKYKKLLILELIEKIKDLKPRK